MRTAAPAATKAEEELATAIAGTAEESGDYIFRAMVEDNGMPKLGTSATTLGIRKGRDIVPDAAGMVHRPQFIPGQPNGLSCADSIQGIPQIVCPAAWGGRHHSTLMWKISVGDLGSELTAGKDGSTHVSVGPSMSMPFDEFVRAIQSTRPKWHKVSKGGN